MEALIKRELSIEEYHRMTKRKDIQIKVPLHAQAAIPEIWIVNLKDDIIYQYTDFQVNQYQRQDSFSRDDQITATRLPLTVKGSELIG